MNHREIVLATESYKSAVEWLMNKNWIAKEKFCQDCPTVEMKLEKNGQTQRWRCGKCKNSTSVFHNTILFNSNLKIVQAIDLIYFWSLNTSQNVVMNEIQTKSRPVIVKWFKKLSLQTYHIMKNLIPRKIGGVGRIIEIDESKFSKRKFNVGRSVRSPWVIGGVDIHSGDLFFREVLFRNRETIHSVLLECVEIGSTIVTDCWAGYCDLEELGYIHLKVNHSTNFVDPITGANTQAIENRWSIFKRKFRARSISCNSDLSILFSEFMFKLKFKEKSFETIMNNLNKF